MKPDQIHHIIGFCEGLFLAFRYEDPKFTWKDAYTLAELVEMEKLVEERSKLDELIRLRPDLLKD